MSEQQTPDISVIIPTYNMAEYVGEAIESVLEGDFEAVEVIVVDDGSTDETEAVVSRYTTPGEPAYDERVRLHSQSNQGKAAAVNRGLSAATGAFVTFLDADDQLTSDSLSALYARRRDEYGRQVDLVIGGFEVFDEESTYGVRLPPDADPEKLRRRFYLRWKTPFHLNASLIPRTLMDRVGALDERFRRCLDGDYAMRLLRVADRVSILQSVVYRYRKHRTSMRERLRTRIQTARYRVQVIWKNYYGWRKWVGIPFGLAVDAGKFGYELLVGNYKE